MLVAAGIAGSPPISKLRAAQTTRYTAKDIPPPAKRTARVEITKGPSLELFKNNEAIVRWTSNNPGGTDEHFGVVKYGTDPHNLNLTAKGHIRLNRTQSYTVFRVRLPGLQPGRTYYYTVGSVEADGTDDGVKSRVYRLSTPRGDYVAPTEGL
jgi:phosphodiesterase/alkaline phosphatase D-like protein